MDRLCPHVLRCALHRCATDVIQVSPDLRSTDAKTISRGITVLSNSQSYVKSFDGIAYEVQGKLQEGATTSDIDAVRRKTLRGPEEGLSRHAEGGLAPVA